MLPLLPLGNLMDRKEKNIWSVSAALFDFVVLTRGQQAEAGRVDEGVIRARALCTTSVRQTHKRKIEDVDTKLDTDQENFDISPNPAPVETQKRICREKTGTDWQTVLDIVKYGEQWSRQSQTEDMKANI
jgi:hypothetical protein